MTTWKPPTGCSLWGKSSDHTPVVSHDLLSKRNAISMASSAGFASAERHGFSDTIWRLDPLSMFQKNLPGNIPLIFHEVVPLFPNNITHIPWICPITPLQIPHFIPSNSTKTLLYHISPQIPVNIYKNRKALFCLVYSTSDIPPVASTSACWDQPSRPLSRTFCGVARDLRFDRRRDSCCSDGNFSS